MNVGASLRRSKTGTNAKRCSGWPDNGIVLPSTKLALKSRMEGSGLMESYLVECGVLTAEARAWNGPIVMTLGHIAWPS